MKEVVLLRTVMELKGKATEARSEAEKAEEWRAAADRIHAVICEGAWDEEPGCFTESVGGKSIFFHRK